MVNATMEKQERAPSRDVWGNARLLGQPAIGICGSRAADEKALELAERFGRLAAKLDLVVVSGNARGVDDAAQFGALAGGGQVISVLAEGMSDWHPRARYRDWVTPDNYAAISDFPANARWQAWRAMQRNETILDLSRALVVVQSGESGGTWEAGLACLRRRLPLLVVQRQEAPETEGNARLIRKGGMAVTTNNNLIALLEKLKAGVPLGGIVQEPLL